MNITNDPIGNLRKNVEYVKNYCNDISFMSPNALKSKVAGLLLSMGYQSIFLNDTFKKNFDLNYNILVYLINNPDFDNRYLGDINQEIFNIIIHSWNLIIEENLPKIRDAAILSKRSEMFEYLRRLFESDNYETHIILLENDSNFKDTIKYLGLDDLFLKLKSIKEDSRNATHKGDSSIRIYGNNNQIEINNNPYPKDKTDSQNKKLDTSLFTYPTLDRSINSGFYGQNQQNSSNNLSLHLLKKNPQNNLIEDGITNSMVPYNIQNNNNNIQYGNNINSSSSQQQLLQLQQQQQQNNNFMKNELYDNSISSLSSQQLQQLQQQNNNLSKNESYNNGISSSSPLALLQHQHLQLLQQQNNNLPKNEYYNNGISSLSSPLESQQSYKNDDIYDVFSQYPKDYYTNINSSSSSLPLSLQKNNNSTKNEYYIPNYNSNKYDGDDIMDLTEEGNSEIVNINHHILNKDNELYFSFFNDSNKTNTEINFGKIYEKVCNLKFQICINICIDNNVTLLILEELKEKDIHESKDLNGFRFETNVFVRIDHENDKDNTIFNKNATGWLLSFLSYSRSNLNGIEFNNFRCSEYSFDFLSDVTTLSKNFLMTVFLNDYFDDISNFCLKIINKNIYSFAMVINQDKSIKYSNEIFSLFLNQKTRLIMGIYRREGEYLIPPRIFNKKSNDFYFFQQ